MGFCIAITLFLRFRNTLQLFVKLNTILSKDIRILLDPTVDKTEFERPQSLRLLRVAGKCNILTDFLKYILRTVSYFSFESEF